MEMLTCDEPFTMEMKRKTQTGRGGSTRHSAHGRKELEEAHTCDVCHKYFARISDLKIHLIGHIGNSGTCEYKCAVCDKMFPGLEILQSHLQRKHNCNMNKAFVCHVCDKRFSHRMTLTEHNKIHTGEVSEECERQFPCALCSSKFSNISLLVTHQRTHTCITKPAFTCEICGLVFTQLEIYNRHCQTKHFEHVHRPHRCGMCGKYFKNKYNLFSHYKVHTVKKETTYRCDICAKTFPSPLKTYNIDMGVTLFYCDSCNKDYRPNI